MEDMISISTYTSIPEKETCVLLLPLFEAVSSGEIIQKAKKKRPKQIELIERELEPLYS